MSEFYVVCRVRKIEGCGPITRNNKTKEDEQFVWEEQLVGPVASTKAEEAIQSVCGQMKISKEDIVRVYYERHY